MGNGLGKNRGAYELEIGCGCMPKTPWMRGALIGAGTVTALAVLFLILNLFGVPFGQVPPLGLLVVALSLITMPVSIIGRVLHLPLENGGAAFMIADLNALGCAAVVLFWALVGALIALVARNNSPSWK